MIRLGIVEYRNVISSLQLLAKLDFSDYALTSLKWRFERFIQLRKIHSSEDLIKRITKDSVFLDQFVQEISVPSSCMFRDPSAWKALFAQIEQTISKHPNYRVWFPDCHSGAELYTFLIILKEKGLLENVKIKVSSFSQLNLDGIQRGSFNLKNKEGNQSNYERYGGKQIFENYFGVTERRSYFDKSLLKNIEFTRETIFSSTPNRCNLVIYRNKLIYFNPQLHKKAIMEIHKNLLPLSYLFIGVKETLDCCSIEDKFQKQSKLENIYKRR